MGGMGALAGKLPGMGGMTQMLEQQDTQSQFARMEAIINSMTPKERANPDILNGSRKRRITNGSGTSIQDLARLLKQHKQMQKMMKKMGSAKGMGKMMKAMDAMGGGAPGGMPAPPQGMPTQPNGLPGLGGGMPFDKKKNPFG